MHDWTNVERKHKEGSKWRRQRWRHFHCRKKRGQGREPEKKEDSFEWSLSRTAEILREAKLRLQILVYHLLLLRLLPLVSVQPVEPQRDFRIRWFVLVLLHTITPPFYAINKNPLEEILPTASSRPSVSIPAFVDLGSVLPGILHFSLSLSPVFQLVVE